MGKTISVSAGSVALKHNRREFEKGKDGKPQVPEHISQDMMMYNTYIKTCRTEREAFNFFFKDSVDEYNAKQTRADRRKTDYYGEIQKSKNGETPIYEYVFQIGNKDDTPCNSDDALVCKRILFEYAMQFQKDNSNFHVISACIHMDEGTPHLHLTFIPWANGYKKGLETRCSTSKALESMGYTGEKRNMKYWKRAQEDKLEKMMNERSIDRVRLGGAREHLTVPLYKETMDKARADAEVQKEQILSSAREELREVQMHLSYAKNDYEAVKNEFEDYLEEKNSISKVINLLRAENYNLTMRSKTLKKQVETLSAEKYTLESEISRLRSNLTFLEGKLDEFNKKLDEMAKEVFKPVGTALERLVAFTKEIKYKDGTSVYDKFTNTEVSLQERFAHARRESDEMKQSMAEWKKQINRSTGSAHQPFGSRTKNVQNESENERF